MNNTQNNNNNNPVWSIFFIVLVLGTLFSVLFPGKPSEQQATFEPDRGSFEHRYVKERVKLEGYSDKEAAQAADAIIKFHNAQKNR